MTSIAGATREQASGLEDVSSAVSQMDRITQQNAAMVEEATAAGHALNTEAQRLDALIGQFSLGEKFAGANSAAAPTRAPTAPIKRPVARAAPRTAGNAALKLRDAPDAWNEF